MELALEADVYVPNVDETGNYVDKPPYKKGIYCPCASRKDKLYNTTQQFSLHTKTKTHMRWMQDLNFNKSNYYKECIELHETIKNQRQIIAKFDIELQNRTNTINILTQQITQSQKKCGVMVSDLLDMN
jgi:hypothetical protein